MTTLMTTIPQRIAHELTVLESQVQAAIQLLDDGATVPFIARYRKEVTGGLDDTQLRNLQERLIYLRELEERKQVILNSISAQDKLTPELQAAIEATDNKTRLEDLYLPYKPKRRTKAQLAREAGLLPLAMDILAQPNLAPEQLAPTYLNPDKDLTTIEQVLEGARQILFEHFAEQADVLQKIRTHLWENARLVSKRTQEELADNDHYADYYDYQEPLKTIPSHRALALFRGRKEGSLQLNLQLEEIDSPEQPVYCESLIAQQFNIDSNLASPWLRETVRSAWRFKIRLRMETELLGQLREQAETVAIKVFANNLQDRLLAAPAGARVIMGLDPGLRTGVKVAVVDKTGKLLQTATIYPHPPKNQWEQSLVTVTKLVQNHQVELISIGNGTASRETDKLIGELGKRHPELHIHKIMVSEAGASVYSASEIAAAEFPDLDVSLRSAVSIARRLQDPLAELVKIDPKSIGVGQYQHDVSQTQLMRSLNAVVEDCVNTVGVDINSASIPLLSRVSGISTSLANHIITYRNEHGAFRNRYLLKNVPRLGEKAFEQAAGFLRITGGDNPLDSSAVHPEAYPVVERILAKWGKPIQSLIGNVDFLRTLNPQEFIDQQFGLPTVTDILNELEKPGRDPRSEFKMAQFGEDVQSMEDLEVGKIVEGVVTNVTDFGAFVDIGVHQDGLIHISALSYTYVKDPREVVKAGDIVKVKVLEVDLKRRRIALTLRLTADNPVPKSEKSKPAASAKSSPASKPKVNKPDSGSNKSTTASPVVKKSVTVPKPVSTNMKSQAPAGMSAMAQAFANARKRTN